MSRIDDLISQKAYELDVLRSYRQIVESGDCNTCKNKECKWTPKPGQFVRYNCPHYINGKKVDEMEERITEDLKALCARRKVPLTMVADVMQTVFDNGGWVNG